MYLLLTCLSLALLCACNDNEHDALPEQNRPQLSATPTSFVQGGSTTFRVVAGQNDVTAQAEITESKTGQAVQGAVWTSDSPGSYTFTAAYADMKSDPVTVEVTKAAPEEAAITLTPRFDTSREENPARIGVFAARSGERYWNEGDLCDLLFNRALEYTDTQWSYSPVAMWPVNESEKVSFFAYAPYASEDNGISVSEESQPGAPVLRYTMVSPNDCHTDIWIAEPQLNLSRQSQAVELPLRSMMAKIGFRIKGQGEKISKIAVRGIQWQGELPLDAADQGSMTWKHTSDYSAIEYEIKLECDPGQEYVTASGTMTDVTARDGFLYLIPQNLTYNARIVVTADGVKLGFPFEDVFQVLPGREYIIDLDIPGDKPLDYTDNAMPAFLIEPLDAAEASNIDWNDAKSACESAGYRLPTYNEGLMILFYMNGIGNHNFRYASYWTSTTSQEDTSVDNAMGYNIMPWMGIYMPKAGLTAARCVRDTPPAGKKYPYVDTSDPAGPVIVSRDEQGGVIPSAYHAAFETELPVFHENWNATPDHDCGTGDDRISRKLQVANANVSAGKVLWDDFACPEGWRKPTMMELAFIYTMGGAVETSYDAGNMPVTDTPLYGVAGFTPLDADYYWAASMNGGKGGRYPATWSFAATPRNGSGTTTDANYVRCVRDIE